MFQKFLQYTIFLVFFFLGACVPSLSKSFMQSVSDFLQLRSLVNTGPFQISVTVSGLVGTGLTLSLNSGLSSLTIDADGNYPFGSTLITGQDFNVSIVNQPILPNQTCSVSGGTGVVGFGNISSIIVNCDPLRYSLGGTITGLDGATGLTLTNAFDGATLPVAVAAGTFAFTQTYVSGSTYNVTVTTQPNHPVQNCIVTNGSGTFASANITTITINCTSTAYPIEITAVGIGSGTLTLSNNGSEMLPIASDGLHRFPTNLPPSSTYNVQIVSSPPGHQCVLSATTGTIAGTVSILANCFSVLSYTPRNGGILLPSESLRLVFSAEVNTGSCAGSMGTLTNTTLALPVQFVLATTNFANDSLVVTPAVTDSWQAGHRTLTLNCLTNVGSHPLSTNISLLYMIPSNLRYVADVGGNDLNDGLTTLTPKRNIQSAIDSFGGCPTGDCAVLVTQGSYDPAAVGDRIQLVSGVSLFGSYEPGFTSWSPGDKDSIIFMGSVPASCALATATSPCASIAADVSITSPVVISGFQIESGSSAPYMAGVFLDSTANVRLIDNTIIAGTSASGSAGVFSTNSNPYLVLNRIEGGRCTSNNCSAVGVQMSSGILIAPVILGNVILGGDAPGILLGATSTGIRYTGTFGIDVTNIRQNIITSLNMDISDPGSTTNSIAFDIGTPAASSTGILAGNQFNHGAAYNSFGIRLQGATNIQIGSATQGNVINGGANARFENIGIKILSSNNIVRRNLINLGTTERNNAFNTTAGIVFTSGLNNTSIIENNTIAGGSANDPSNLATSQLIGINVSAFGPSSSISGNHIRLGIANGGGTSVVSGIGVANSGPFLLSNNWIQNGTSNRNARGINLAGITSALRVYHNTVSSGPDTPGNDAAIYLSGFSNTLLIENNIFYLNSDVAGNACIYNLNGTSGATRYNVFHNCTNKVFQAALNYTDICAGGVPGSLGCVTPLGLAPNFGNNLNLDPNFVSLIGVYSYIPTAASSCLITRSTNTIIADSYNGLGTRPGGDGGVSLGAIEYNLPCTP
ncbi:hypothetical protein EHQ92_17145 [Leptospira biflexa]|uniref:hypothetical protein n=1 Tax=Leptospira biflexa TaxID=172 RepID=UPI0010917EAD|nr:hypothetical protein [Leptospira biflexa]TGM42512.1 hypothetical protein EHQ92_17145 [Leptospira biflexa]TGM44398.1 hypothetical protein EHQ88_17480 [Leptospira biflexa]